MRIGIPYYSVLAAQRKAKGKGLPFAARIKKRKRQMKNEHQKSGGTAFDCIIRGGTVVDGTGAPPRLSLIHI